MALSEQSSNPKLLPLLAVALTVLITVASGGIYGMVTNRWRSRDMEAIAERLQSFPSQLGPSGVWRLRSSDQLEESAAKMLRCAGSIVRTYSNERTGETVNLTLLVGPTGPIAVHTPDICYSSRDYTIIRGPERCEISSPEGQDCQFWSLTLRREDVNQGLLRVYYAWSTEGDWSAPSQARLSFAGKPYLCKLQLATSIAPEAIEKEDAGERFLQDCMGVVRDYLKKTSQ